MEKDKNLAEDKPKPKAHEHTLLWFLVGLVVVASIGAMFAIDYFYADDQNGTAKAVKSVDD